MTQADRPQATPAPSKLINLAQQVALLFAGMCAVAVFTAAGIKGVSEQKWIYVIAAVATPALLYGISRNPHLITFLTFFLLYANLPIVAMKYHGIPFAVAAAVPFLLLIPIAYNVFFRGERICFPMTALPILVFFIIQTLSTICSTHADVAMSLLYRSIVEGIVVVVLVVNAVKDRETLQGCIWALALGGALMGIACTHQYVTKSYHRDYGGLAQLEEPRNPEMASVTKTAYRRAAGTVGVKNRFAQNMLMLLPIAFCSYFGIRSARGKFVMSLLTLFIFLGWAVVFSRGSAIGLAMVCLIGACLGLLRWRQLSIIAIGASILLLSLPQYRTRLASLTTLTRVVDGKNALAQASDGSIRGRFTEMLAAGRVAADYPILGVGPGVFPYFARKYSKAGGLRELETKRQAHNLYLGIAAELGLPGLICLVFMVGITIRELLRLRGLLGDVSPQLGYALCGLALALMAYMITGMFSHFSFVRFFWLMMALSQAAIYIANRELAKNPAPPTCSNAGVPLHAS